VRRGQAPIHHGDAENTEEARREERGGLVSWRFAVKRDVRKPRACEQGPAPIHRGGAENTEEARRGERGKLVSLRFAVKRDVIRLRGVA
jgi:hypothetical protein